jgi:signal transduction histidine kinase
VVPDGQYTEKFVQVFEADGRLRLASISLGGRPALVQSDVIRQGLEGRAPIAPVRVGERAGRATVLTARMGSDTYAILVGLYRDEIDGHLAWLAWVLAAVWFAGIAATSAQGYLMASTALAPVVGITRRAERISGGDFSARLDPPAVHDEVGEMTESLNTVLERLNGALQAHRRFAADASHELRAPLTAIAGEVDVALAHPRTGEEYRDTLQIVRERAASLSALCEDLILLVQAQEGAPGVELREVFIREQLAEAARRLEADASARRIRIEARDLPDLIAYADPRLLARVFDNVLTNAVHYNREGGRVTVGGTAEPPVGGEWTSGTATITVSDTGCGIPPAEVERVFDRFYRVDRSRTRRTGGSGLGLAICREVLTVLGGSIRVRSSSSEGTTIEITVPGRRASDRTVSETLAPRCEAAARNDRVAAAVTR